jgi:hypothetical protein
MPAPAREREVDVEPKGFLSSLFDTSFSSLITTRVIRVIYIISMVVIALAALFWVAAAFARSPAAGLLVLIIVAPIVSLLYLIYTRVLLEVIIALFRIMETNIELVELQRGALAPAVPAPTSPPMTSEAPTTPQPPASAPPPAPPPPDETS